jgi:hypothetical protein
MNSSMLKSKSKIWVQSEININTLKQLNKQATNKEKANHTRHT